MKTEYAMKIVMRILAVVLLVLISTGSAWAQQGKIRGVVTDAETGQTLPGANVVVEGTTLGASTGAEGRYTILQVPSGTHDLVVSFIGYHKKTVTGVEVQSGLTAEIDVELAPETMEVGEVTVTADQKMVQQDLTATRRTYSREELETAPGVSSSMDIFRMQGGVVEGGPPQQLQLPGAGDYQVRDQSLKDIHLRGGRGGEILYLVDGVPITHPIFGGRSVLDLDMSQIEEIEVLTGTFSAEYGNAQSGVVRITTRSGTTEWGGGTRYETDSFDALGESFDAHNGRVYLSGPEPLTKSLLPSLGINVPGDVTFFASAGATVTDTRYNNNRIRPTYSLPLTGLDLTAKQDNTVDVSGKVTWRPNPRIRSVLSYNGSWKRWTSFNWQWRNLSDHMVEYGRDNHSLSWQLRHTVSDKTYYDLRAGYLTVDYDASLDGMTPDDFWLWVRDSVGTQMPQQVLNAPQVSDTTGFYYTGYQNFYRDDFTRSLSLTGTVRSQVHPDHMITLGFDARSHDLEYVDLQGVGTQLSYWAECQYYPERSQCSGSDAVQASEPPPGPFQRFSKNRWVFNANPIEGAFYLDEKYEISSFVLNAGVRMDWFTPGSSVFTDSWQSQWCDATGLCEEEGDPGWSRFKYELSPRFGVSFPIMEFTQIYFSYGHFYQLPEMQFYYRDPYTGGFTGNPDLDYAETIKYEFGLSHQFAENWMFDVKSYNNDISGQVGTTQLNAHLGLPVSLYDNKSYARARGLEFKTTNRNRYSTWTSGEATYTVQWAKGYASSAFDEYVFSQNDMPNPIRERRLGYDVRHQFVLRATLKSPDVNPLRLFGFTFPKDWQLSLMSRLDSGQPYTPGVLDPVEAQRLHNTESGPPTYRTDLRFRKRFDVGGGKLGLFAEVFNVFDQRNATVGNGYFWFNQWTGQPFVFGDTHDGQSAPQTQMLSYNQAFRNMSPQRYTMGRRVQFGIQYDF